MKDKTPFYRKALHQTFASENYNAGQCDAFLADFDKLTRAGMSGEAACGIVYAAWGGSAPEKVCRTIKDWIETELDEFNSSHRGINTNPLTRLRACVKRFNEAIDKCAVEINGKPMSKADIERIKVKLPGCLNPPTTYSASASARGKATELTLEVSE